MTYSTITEALSRKTGPVKLRGWAHRVRQLKDKAFIVLRDTTDVIQCVASQSSLPEKDWLDAKKVSLESSLELGGILREEKRAPGGAEVQVTSLKLHHAAERFPIEGGETEAFLLDKRHLWIRSREQNAVMKVRDTVFSAARGYFHGEGFYEVTPPIVVGTAAEGGSTLFEMDYFGQKAYLSQSAQFYLEAMCFNLEKVFAFSPSFRAEKSRTRRHLTEFTHLEGEMAWMGQKENMDVQEGLVSRICMDVAEKNKKELQVLGRDPKTVASFQAPYERIKYSEILEVFRKKCKMDFAWGTDFGADEEKALMQHFGKPIFVTHYPKEIKAFYMRVDHSDPKVVLNADMLAPEGRGEIIGGSERETDLKSLLSRLEGDPAPYEWYFDLRRYGSVQHSGFGLGVERVIAWLCNLEHIRDATPFPRLLNRCNP